MAARRWGRVKIDQDYSDYPRPKTAKIGKSLVLMGKSTISMAIFNSYFSITLRMANSVGPCPPCPIVLYRPIWLFDGLPLQQTSIKSGQKSDPEVSKTDSRYLQCSNILKLYPFVDL
jgi:hypothetical protein